MQKLRVSSDMDTKKEKPFKVWATVDKQAFTESKKNHSRIWGDAKSA